MTPAEILAEKKKGMVAAGLRGPSRGKAIFVCRLRPLREALGLSAKDVAEEIGYSRAAIEQAELGYRCSLCCALRLAALFGRTVDELWSLADDAPTPGEG